MTAPAQISEPIQQIYVPGFSAGVTWTPDGGGAVPVAVTGWDVDDGGDLSDVSSTLTAGQQGLLACLQRGGGSVSLNFNAAQIPTSGLGIRFGSKGTFTFATGTTNPWICHVSIASVKHKSVVNGVVSLSIDVKTDALTASGSVVQAMSYPS